MILNVEEWRIENAMPRTVLSLPMGQLLLPDVPNWAWHEYGMRVGFWRQLKALTDRNVPTTLAINGNVCTSYPRVAAAARDAGFEFMGHGFRRAGCTRWITRPMRSSAPSIPSRHSPASAPRSWESPGLTETEATLDLLRLNGVEYVADWVDRRPAAGHRHPSWPGDNSFPTPSKPTTSWSTPCSIYRRISSCAGASINSTGSISKATTMPRVMAISIHPYITGVPHRIKYLEQLLDYVISHDGVALMTASEIGDWYRARRSSKSWNSLAGATKMIRAALSAWAGGARPSPEISRPAR